MAKKKPDYASLYFQRKDGRYQGKYTDRDGVRHTITDKDPESLYHRIAKAEAASQLPPPPEVLLFKELAKAWHDDAETRLRDGTWACYESFYNRAVERFGEEDAAQITTPDVYELLALLASQRRSVKSVRMQRVVLSQIYSFGLNNRKFARLLNGNPARDAALPKNAEPSRTREAPEDDIIAAIRAAAGTAYFGLFPLWLISTGMRRGEALSMRWGNIDFAAASISVTGSVSLRNGRSVLAPTKTAAGVRTVPLLPDLAAALAPLPKGRKTDFIFPGEDASKPMPESTFKRKWLHYCKEMGFVEETQEPRISAQGHNYIHTDYKATLTPHTLRHGYATLLFEAGVDVYTAQRLLGHANIDTTMGVYTHLRKRQEDRSIARLTDSIQNALNGNL